MAKEHSEMQQLAHDLRNALSSIYGYAQLLELSLSKQGLEQEHKTATALLEAARKMQAMITERAGSIPPADSGR